MTTLLNSNSLLWQNQISLWQNKYTEFCKKNNIMIKSHQIEGVIWCLQRELVSSSSSLREEVEGEAKVKKGEENKRRGGGILADEMGMGKTIQMIGIFMLNPVKKTLLIVPPILVNQWHAEIRKFTGHVATIYYGKDRKKIDMMNPKVMVVITSYETVVRDISSFKEVAWNRVVCDEAHHLRNPKTLIYTAVRDVLSSTNTKASLWMITGTPMHHSAKDLYSLYFLFGYSVSELSGEKGLVILRSHFLQRRHKESDLPKKTEHTIMIEWTETGERDLAKDIHKTIPFLGFSLGEGEQENESFWEKKKRPLLVSMIRAKQTCILSKMTEKSYLPTDEVDVGQTVVEQTIPFLATFDQSTTTKLQEILRLLNSRRENGNGKVIFCHYQLEMTYLLDKLSKDKPWVGTWNDYKKIDNDIDSTSILGESPILILQIQSGCEGLNLQAHFSEVYFVSPDWNPTLEEQAIARCWRIGQKKPVEVFRFSMNFVDTPEHNFQRRNEVQKYRSLFDPLPFDIQDYISSFLPASDSTNLENARKYSMDQYTFVHSEKKRNRIQLFLSKIA